MLPQLTHPFNMESLQVLLEASLYAYFSDIAMFQVWLGISLSGRLCMLKSNGGCRCKAGFFMAKFVCIFSLLFFISSNDSRLSKSLISACNL